MLKPIRQLVRYTTSKRGAKITLLIWLIAAVVFIAFAPSAKDFQESSSGGSITEDMPSEVALDIEKDMFPSKEGLTALLVFHEDDEISKANREQISQLSEWLASDNKPKNVQSALPYHEFPEPVQKQMFSDDQTTLLFNVTLEENLESDEIHKTLDDISNEIKAMDFKNIQLEITGPAGISADTITLFKNGDFVLMIATVILIFFILILIYRSPLLAITPLIIAGIVYIVVDGILGLSGQFELFAIDGQATSIMLVLLFAVLTDYSLFVFSRYREELQKHSSKYTSMSEAMYHVSEPIFFSGGTILLAMLALFATIFEPYHHFAPVFSIAVLIIAIAGLTLIPSIFAIMGRRAFWPFIPAVNKQKKKKNTFWSTVGQFVKKHPATIAISLLVILFIGASQVPTINYSYNLLKTFPEDMSSRKGFELLEERYPAGLLAPVTIILESETEIEKDELFLQHIKTLTEQLSSYDNVSDVTNITDEMVTGKEPLPTNMFSETDKAIKLTLTLESNPYDMESLNVIQALREDSDKLLSKSGLSSSHYELHFSGQTAEQLDIKQMNQRDMMVLFPLVIVLITIVLAFQTRKLSLSILMVGTILLSYVASLGFSWTIFHYLLDYDAIGYRLPVYTFVFMVALGIDYNIMLVSRVRELAKEKPWQEAVASGVAMTGGVISSAGLILAATFAVLMTQPLEELFLFGFTMAFGILLDTFVIRGFLLPAILIWTHRNKDKQQKYV
ncbi:MAG TPA: MMPL family transporter [Cerasibacillus sp.]|uniref:MMPL family transporter n=1 Tax=Cerasibacillus sp. TaxID=2498711 RepID=UPI002F413171